MMKRNGFVSNSSSSSFTVLSKKEEISVDDLMSIFDVGEKSPLRSITVKICEEIIDIVSKLTEDEMKNEKEYQKYFDKGFNMFWGNRFLSDCDTIRCLIQDMNINYKSDELIVKVER